MYFHSSQRFRSTSSTRHNAYRTIATLFVILHTDSILRGNVFRLPTLVEAVGTICGDDDIIPEENVKNYTLDQTKRVPFAPPPPKVNGTSHEWVFESVDPNEFLTVDFSKFDLGGPDCDEQATRYSRVMVETQLNGAVARPLLFCKGRRPPDPMSTMGKLRVAYCHRYTTGTLEFVVTKECKANLLARKTEKELRVEKSHEICWIILTSLEGGITVDISNLDMKQSSSRRCKKAFINMTSVDNQNTERSILPGGKTKICKVEAGDLVNLTQFEIYIEEQKVKIAYRNAAFKLKFKAGVSNTFSTDSNLNFVTGTIVNNSPTNDTLGNYLNDEDGTGSSTDMTHIIALGCGGLFILFVIIATIFFVRRRSNSRVAPFKSKGRNSTRISSVKYSQPATLGMTRNPSLGSINNAMYGQLLSGDDTTMRNTEKEHETKRKSSKVRRSEESRRKRLAELEEKYGPFSETSDTYPEPHYVDDNRVFCAVPATTQLPEQGGIFRKGSRPLLPPPPGLSSFGVKCDGAKERVNAPANLYETIGDVTMRNQTRASQYASETSDEFSDCDELPKVSYDPVARENSYTSVLDGPAVSYDAVESDEHQVREVKYAPNKIGDTHEVQVQSVKYQVKTPSAPRNTPTIDVYHVPNPPPPVLFSQSTSLLDSTPNPRMRLPDPNLVPAKSHGAIYSSGIIRDIRNQYQAPRPSLPEITSNNGYLTIDSERSCSIGSSLQEDADNYLQPRPSCPDAVMICAYSSSEDISEMRRRIVAAAHPCLLDNHSSQRIVDDKTSPAKSWYDSPRPSLGEIEEIDSPKAQYATPRRVNQPTEST